MEIKDENIIDNGLPISLHIAMLIISLDKDYELNNLVGCAIFLSLCRNFSDFHWAFFFWNWTKTICWCQKLNWYMLIYLYLNFEKTFTNKLIGLNKFKLIHENELFSKLNDLK